MKKIFPVFLICWTTFVFADNAPIFEETEEKVQRGASYATFAPEEPIFEEDDEKEACKGCEEGHKELLFRAEMASNVCEGDEEQLQASYVSWRRFKANFGMEKLYVRFPQKPTVAQSNAFLTAYAWDYGNMYSLTGYFPPIGNIHPIAWFDEILYTLDRYPYTLHSHVIFQASNGDWIMDYVAHDYIQNTILKARSIATPFNGYTLQVVKPNGARDYFDYFLDNFYIKCECH